MSVRSILVTQRIPSVAIDALKKAAVNCLLDYWDHEEPLSDEVLKEKIGLQSAVLVTLETKIKGEIMSHITPNLKCVSTMTVGFDHLDVNGLKSMGIRVGNTPDVLTDTTAELVIALTLATSRRLLESHKCLLNGSVGRWNPNWMCGKDLKGSTVGFVGFGRIGKSVAKKLSCFDVAKFLYTKRSENAEKCSYGDAPCERVDLDTLLNSSDFVIVLCSSNEGTRLLVNRDFLGKMKKDAILINASRGDVLNQQDLEEALRNGTIGAAGLDVTTPEPLPKDHPLLHLPNCTVLPHIGSASVNTRNAMALLAVENLIAALEDKPMPAEV